MKATELSLEKENFNMSCKIYAPGSHYKFIMRLGRVFPTTKAQAKQFISGGHTFDVLNDKDVEMIEALLKKHNYTGNYQYTSSKKWVHLLNVADFEKALKAEYGL